MSKHLIHLSVILLVIACESCKKDAVPSFQLPETTQSGANTFGCKIAGKIFVPYVKCNESYRFDEFDYNVFPIQTSSFTSGSRIILSAVNSDFPSPGTHTSLQISMWTDTVITQTGDIAPDMYFLYLQDPDISYEKRRTDSDHFFITKFDPVAKVISGTFDVTLYGASFSDILRITDGRFDLKIDQDFKRPCTN